MTFEVADVAAEAILGTAFLKTNQFLVDIAGVRLLWDRGGDGGRAVRVCRVVCSKMAVIAPGEESMVEGYVVGDWEGEEGGLVEGLREIEDRRGWLVGRALVDPRTESTPVSVFNPGQEAVVVYRDMTLATVEPVTTPPPGGGRAG